MNPFVIVKVDITFYILHDFIMICCSIQIKGLSIRLRLLLIIAIKTTLLKAWVEKVIVGIMQWWSASLEVLKLETLAYKKPMDVYQESIKLNQEKAKAS
jgi:hypothetical protein